MKKRMGYGIVLYCLTAIVALAQNAGLEGTWVTDGVPAVEAAIKAKKSTSGLAEGTRIKFKVDTKKNKVSGSIYQLNTDKEFDIVDGVLTDKTFTFKSVEVVGFANNSGGGRNGGFGNSNSNSNAPLTIAWKGELTDASTVTLKRLSATGEPTADPPVVYHRGK
jgi:hypothetical protein